MLKQSNVQKFFKPMTEDEKLTTLGQLLKQFKPEAVVELDETEDPDIIKSYEVRATGLNRPYLSTHLADVVE